MKASKFKDAQKAFIIKQAEDGATVAGPMPSEPAHASCPCV